MRVWDIHNEVPARFKVCPYRAALKLKHLRTTVIITYSERKPSMNDAMIKVGKYCITNNLRFSKTKSGKGFISYDISAVAAHTDKLVELADKCEWKLLEMKPKYNAQTNSMSAHRYYLGFVNSNECQDENDFVI